MGQLARPAADAALRRWLIEQRSEFRAQMASTMLNDSAESAAYAWRETSKSVDPLTTAGEAELRRYELPDGHPARVAGHPCDLLVLDADDVLRTA